MGDHPSNETAGPSRLHKDGPNVGDRVGASAPCDDSTESSSVEEMESEADFRTFHTRRLKRKLRRTSSTAEPQPALDKGKRCFTISYVPMSTSDNLNSLNRQSLTNYFERVAPAQVNEIRINSRKNILSVDVTNKTILDKLKAVTQLGSISVRAFLAHGKGTTTGVINDVDADITDADLQNLVTSTVRIVTIRRFGQSRCIKLVFDSETLPPSVKVGYVRHPVRPYVPRPLQCHKCCKLGHVSAVCKSETTCQRCGGSHKVENCDTAVPLKCPNCSGAHEATSKECPKIKEEIRVLRKMVRDNSTHREAVTSIRRHRRRPKRRHQRKHSGHRSDASPSATDEHTRAHYQAATPMLYAPRPRDAESGPTPALHADASDTEWPSLPTGAIKKTTSWAATSKRAENDRQDTEKSQTMLKHLLKSIRAILNELHTPGAKTAVQILNVLEPLLLTLP